MASDQLINLAVLKEPFLIASLSTFGHFFKEFDGFGFIAGFAWVIDRGDHVDLDSDDESTSLDQSGPLESFSLDSHDLIPLEEVNGHQFRNATLPQERPNGLKLGAIG